MTLVVCDAQYWIHGPTFALHTTHTWFVALLFRFILYRQAKLSGGQKLTCLDWTYERVLGSCASEEVVRYVFTGTTASMTALEICMHVILCYVALCFSSVLGFIMCMCHTYPPFLFHYRLWDFERAENYTLTTGAGSGVITHFSYNPNTCLFMPTCTCTRGSPYQLFTHRHSSSRD